MKIVASLTTLAVAMAVALPQAHDSHDRVRPPRVPGNLQVEAGNKPFFKGHAIGTQNYICLPAGAGFAWAPWGPQATLFDDDAKQVITHYLSANPQEANTPRATWQHSKDTSATWAVMDAFSTDAAFVAPGAIPWLLLRSVGYQVGPTGGDKLTPTTFIHRVNTAGGIIPATGCAVSTDVGKKALVPYEADYFFYKHAGDGLDGGN